MNLANRVAYVLERGAENLDSERILSPSIGTEDFGWLMIIISHFSVYRILHLEYNYICLKSTVHAISVQCLKTKREREKEMGIYQTDRRGYVNYFLPSSKEYLFHKCWYVVKFALRFVSL